MNDRSSKPEMPVPVALAELVHLLGEDPVEAGCKTHTRAWTQQAVRIRLGHQCPGLTQDVLLMAGAVDHYVPASQVRARQPNGCADRSAHQCPPRHRASSLAASRPRTTYSVVRRTASWSQGFPNAWATPSVSRCGVALTRWCQVRPQHNAQKPRAVLSVRVATVHLSEGQPRL